MIRRLRTAVGLRKDPPEHDEPAKIAYELSGKLTVEERLLFSDHIVMVSGRSSFEILQKCLTAGMPVVCAISALSSLAVDAARQFNMSLVGFLCRERFNLYAQLDTILLEEE